MKKFISSIVSIVLAGSLSASAFAVDSPHSRETPVQPYTPVIVNPEPRQDPGKINTPTIVVTPTGTITAGTGTASGAASGTAGAGSAQSGDFSRMVIMPEFGKVTTTTTTTTTTSTNNGKTNDKVEKTIAKNETKVEKTENKTNAKDAKNQEKIDRSNQKTDEKVEKILGKSSTEEETEELSELFAAIVRETVTQSSASEKNNKNDNKENKKDQDVSAVDEDPIKDSILPEQMHYYAIDEATKIGVITNETVEEVVMKANAENRSIVSVIVITADEDVAWKIGKQENNEDRYVAFTFYPEAIGITENDVETLVVFVNGHPITLVKNEDGSFTIKLSEWGLVTFEIANR